VDSAALHHGYQPGTGSATYPAAGTSSPAGRWGVRDGVRLRPRRVHLHRPLPPAAAAQLARSRKRIREFHGRRGARARLACWQAVNPAGVMVGSAFQVMIGHLRGLSRQEQNTRLRALLHDAVADCQRMLCGPAAGVAAPDDQLSEPLP
jgi:hypothetical protein